MRMEQAYDPLLAARNPLEQQQQQQQGGPPCVRSAHQGAGFEQTTRILGTKATQNAIGSVQ
jgi:hypothetical protein